MRLYHCFIFLSFLSFLVKTEDQPSPLSQSNETSLTPPDEQTTDDKKSLYIQNFLMCTEDGQCGLDSICSFRFERVHAIKYDAVKNTISVTNSKLPKHTNIKDLEICPDEEPNEEDDNEESENLKKTNNPNNNNIKNISPWIAVLQTFKSKKDKTKNIPTQGFCKRRIEGHLFSIKNEIDSHSTFYWDVADSVPSSGEIKTDGMVFVPANSVRYFMDTVYKTHIVRLVVGDQMVAEKTAHTQHKCKEEDACYFLYALCSQYYEDKKRYAEFMEQSLVENDEIENYCEMYTSECNNYASKKVDREQCVTNCLKIYWPETFNKIENNIKKYNNPTGFWESKNLHLKKTDQTNKNVDDSSILPTPYIMDCLIQTPEYKQFKDTKSSLSSLTVDTESSSAGWITAFIVISVILFIALVMLFCWVPYWGANGELTSYQVVSRRYLVSQTDTKPKEKSLF